MKAANLLYVLAVVLILLGGISCSGAKSPVVPDDGDSLTAEASYDLSAHNRYLWGYYDCTLNTETGEISVRPVRGVRTHFNILTFLENGPCTNCLRITNTEPLGTVPGWAFDVQITHPFDIPRFRGFDVRAIVIFRATWHWEFSEIYMSNLEADNPEVINADGHTMLYRSSTAGSGPGGLQGYQEGNWATEYAPGSHINGFVNYESDIADNTRNVFNAGDSVTRTIQVQCPEEFPSVWRFGYAIDASWAPPSGTGEDLSEFPPEANCPEPYALDIIEQKIGYGLFQYGGVTNLKIRVREHEPTMSHLAPRIEAPMFEDDILTAKFYGYEGEVPVWLVEIKNDNMADEGTYRILVSVEDELNEAAPEYLNLTHYQLYEIDVAGYIADHGWAQTWGYTGSDMGTAVTADHFANVYVAGTFEGAVDFNPDPDDLWIRTSYGLTDCFLAKYDSNGNIKWVQSWGGEMADEVNDIDITDDGEVFVVGRFGSTVDFDPTSEGEHLETASGVADAYLTKFDFTRNWHWVHTWGGSEDDSADGVSFQRDQLYVSGSFEGSTDFGGGGPVSVSYGDSDAYVVRFDPLNADYIWARTWGGDNADCASDVDFVYLVAGGRVYVCGYFNNNADTTGIDFDPGPDDYIISSWGMADAFVSKFDSATSDHILTYTWGAGDNDNARGVNGDFINGWFVGGYISGVVDFDPSTNEYWSNFYGLYDAFLIGFDSSDDSFLWGFNWGGPGFDWINDVDGDLWGSPFVVGGFTGTVDFDPTTGTNSFTSNGDMDCFISSFQNVDGSYFWTHAWGGPFADQAYGVVGGDWMDTFTTGYFNDTVNFSPGTEADNHTSEGLDDAFLMKLQGDGTWDE